MKNLKRIALLLLAAALFQGCAEKDHWDLVWSEEFEYSGSPATGNWAYETGYIRNNELQYYSDKPENVRVEDGLCIITVRLEEKDSIISASINTLGKKDFLNG